MPGLRRAPHQGLLPRLPRDRVERLRAPRRARSSCCGSDIADWTITFVAHRARVADRRAAAPGAPPRRGRGDLPRQLRRRAHRRPDRRHDRDVPRARTPWPRCSSCRRSPSFHCVDVDAERPRRARSPGHATCRSGRTAATSCCVPRSIDYIPENGDLVGDACGEPGEARAACSPTPTTASGSPPTPSRSATRSRPPTGRGDAPLDGVGARARAHAAGGPRRRGPRPLRHAHADPRGPRRAGPARRALRRHRDRRGRHAAHALPGPPRPARAAPWCSPAAGHRREDEERAALAAFCPGADLAVTVRDMPDGRLPAPLGVGQGGARGASAGPASPTSCSRRAPGRRPPGPPRPRPSRPDGVPRPPGAGLRDPQMGARPRPTAPALAAGARGRRGEEPPAPRALPVPGLPRLVRRRGLPRASPASAGCRPGCATRRAST